MRNLIEYGGRRAYLSSNLREIWFKVTLKETKSETLLIAIQTISYAISVDLKMINQKHFFTIYRNCASRVAFTKRPGTLSSKFCAQFKEYYPKLIDRALEQNKYIDHPLLKDRIKKISEHFILSKFPIQGEFLIHAYELLEKPENITKEKLNQAYILACSTEVYQTYISVQDDVYDMSKTRSGKPCWHLMPDASALAINDTTILRSFMNEILGQNIDESMYTQVINVFNEMYLVVEMGQLLDLYFTKTKNYDDFTMEAYNRMCYMKASYPFMNSATLFALILCNKANEESFKLVFDLCNELGVFIQIHNDFTECFDVGESMSKKSTNDIENNKLSWTAVVALRHFNTEQRNIFNECYGNSNPEKIKRIIQLYEEVNLRQLFKEEENARYNNFLRKVQNLPANATPPPDYFMKIFNYFKSYASDSSRFYYA
ncbi:unnamed protein product [Parnassius apollo]|uniref:(apollo) hypothetical protein n=1 Tax=Parnassius apollo TaxID=110799 RepID=A0A8S3XZ58_PARAO|nr:unnamed protein product [Parnassius apollo]